MSAEIPAGAMRFNSDSQKLEYWNGSAWFQIHTATPNLATAGDRQPGARGCFGGGHNPDGSKSDVIDYINLSSTGDAVDFGNLTVGRGGIAASSNSTRATFAGGNSIPAATNHIDYITIASTGDALNFGDLMSTMFAGCGCSDSHGGLS